ncbi:hypothetical protein STSP2_02511 [Anaerohalosphaera lusitana]|uniref:RHS repeat-associated core domain protein n=1 Tax=Anaerohalosphaera lusitana TaxID=1936003 RepID=A0A1U9NMZ4_9BACT|nr:hypothetical protein STSP2_02511 [Anaerohalosphaera lusitana]
MALQPSRYFLSKRKWCRKDIATKVDHITTANTRIYYYNDNWQVLAEYDGSDSFKRYYVYGNYIDEPLMTSDSTTDLYYAHDHLYSTAALIDTAGNIVDATNTSVASTHPPPLNAHQLPRQRLMYPPVRRHRLERPTLLTARKITDNPARYPSSCHPDFMNFSIAFGLSLFWKACRAGSFVFFILFSSSSRIARISA